jgi:phosphomannomutase/phosphoglucomutase
MSVFRAYDIRGVYGKDLTEEVMENIGKALGTFLEGNKTVCVGYDVRNSSESLYKAFCSGLLSTGCNIIFIGLIPNPILYFYSWKSNIFGAYITASHNPKEWNGLKLVRPDGISFIDELKDLKKIYESQNFLKGKGNLTEDNALEKYKKFLMDKIGKVTGKVVVESFGATGTIILDMLREFGLEVIGLHDKIDGNFYGFKPEPKGENMKMLRETVKREGADFGVAYDCDLDRSVFVDETGKELNGSMMTPVFSEYILKKEKGPILVTADCSSEIEKRVKKMGGTVIWWRVGHGFIEQKGMEENVLFSAEQSSHFWFNKFYHFSDGILTTLMAAKLLSETDEKLSELVNKTKINPMEKMYIDVKTDKNKLRIMDEINKRYPDALNIMDGVKIMLNDTEWVLIRASQTTPKINLCIEAKTEDSLKKIREEYTTMVNSI